MADIAKIKAGQGFAYNAAPQGSPEWIASRIGKVTASRLVDWLAESKPNKAGEVRPLKARLDYEQELAYERQFQVPFTKFVTGAMREGTEAEAAVAEQYAKATGNPIETCGAFYNDYFVASPDRLSGEDGLVEIKWLYDTSFTEVLREGVIPAHYLQIQGQLMATGRKWCDYVAGNGTTGKFKVIRVKRDADTIKRIKDSLAALDEISGVIDTDNLYDMTEVIQFETTGEQGDPWS